jgi:CPA2 family monovalent cation:H+ antiporter-2
MPHETPLIATIVAGLVLAFVFGATAHRFRMPPLVGYLLAGIAVGPRTPGFVADAHLAQELAEIGVILLMFGVGLHFSLRDLLSVRALAVPGAIVQIACATLLGWLLSLALGWPTGGGLIFGLALSVASTVVLLKALQERRLVNSERGRIAVGWLIVEDLAMVLALVLIPPLAGLAGIETEAREPVAMMLLSVFGLDVGIGGLIAITLVKVAAFVGLMLIVGRRLVPGLLHRIAHSGSHELFRLGVLAIALGIAFGASELFGVSLALGAFFAGMILSESELSHRAAEESLPLRDAFSVLFFVSVGMLFDPLILLREPLLVLATVLIIMFGKSVAAFLIVLAFRKTVGTALTISASLAQIGEFSFILAGMGVALGLLPEQGRDLILAGAIISIMLNPVVFFLCERGQPRIEARLARIGMKPALAGAEAHPMMTLDGSDPMAGAPATEISQPAIDAGRATAAADDLDGDSSQPTSLVGHAILVGYGRVGSIVGRHLAGAGLPFLAIEDDDKRIETLRQEGIETIIGNAAAPDILALANPTAARTVVIAIPNAFEAGQVVAQVRRLNSLTLIVARAHSDAEVEYLKGLGANSVIMGEREIARGMIERLEWARSGHGTEDGATV